MFGAVLSGRGDFMIGDEMLNLSKGDGYIVPSNVGISILPVSDFSYLTVCLKKEWITFFKQFKIHSFLKHDIGNELLYLAQDYKKNQVNEEKFIERLLEIFQVFNHKSKNSNKKESDYVKKAVNYIQKNCDQRFDLDELSNSIYLSKYYFIRLFKHEMGITPKQYHEQCKIRMLKRKIFEGSKSQAAYELNFTSQSHMGSIFKKYMGITVQDYVCAIDNVKKF